MLDGAVDIVFTEASRFANLQQTGGSTAIRTTGQAGMRVVGAAAREMLVQAAARLWQVDVRTLTTVRSTVSHEPSGRTARYGELAASAARLSVPASPRLKPRERYTLVGTGVPRLDVPTKVTGAFTYGIDLSFPGMRYAAMESAPVHGGRLAAYDEAAALRQPGVNLIHASEDAVAVVARSHWQAFRGLAALNARFTDGGHGDVSSMSIAAQQVAAFESGERTTRLERGDAPAVLSRTSPELLVEADYHLPFLHHAAMEPINATAKYAEGRLTLWTGHQNPLAVKAKLVELSGLAADSVQLVAMPLGGSFGRRGASNSKTDDYMAMAIDLARKVSPDPVKLIWSREEDFVRGAYRPRLASRMRAALDDGGQPLAFSQVFIEGPPTPVEEFHLSYRITNQLIQSVRSDHHVRTGSWRSVNHSQHGFWTECFIDELAHAAGHDPVAYRRELLVPDSRERRVLDAVAERADWDSTPPTGIGRGVALVKSFGTVVAHVVEASLEAESTTPRVHRVVSVVDCGDVCNPDTARQQVEGAVIMGLSAAIGEQVTIRNGRVEQRNFPDYPILTLGQSPDIDVHFVRSDGPWGGLGEPGLPPAAPALANALFAATGRRLRRLPITAALAGGDA
jgi:isoquinoline 1-oxidoreductase beta subunit